jgi:hypothetical protein
MLLFCHGVYMIPLVSRPRPRPRPAHPPPLPRPCDGGEAGAGFGVSLFGVWLATDGFGVGSFGSIGQSLDCEDIARVGEVGCDLRSP